ncbi:hypothetical protein ACFH04_08445 [Streptomyces noboritoensis]|uniref:Uncharacterized protein n=1 Tax=Streptomyces noboritoensis TaxID=67337 RepID=A0ABV6TD91_9ACTN
MAGAVAVMRWPPVAVSETGRAMLAATRLNGAEPRILRTADINRLAA